MDLCCALGRSQDSKGAILLLLLFTKCTNGVNNPSSGQTTYLSWFQTQHCTL